MRAISRSLLIVIATLLAVNVCLHTFVSGWGNLTPGSSPDGPVPYGVVYGSGDNLSYSSWAQQAKHGHLLFSDLHTTTPHQPLLFNLFFCVTGLLAGAFSTSPILMFNLVALLCIPVFAWTIYRLGTALGFDRTVNLVVLCLILGGGGISWLRLLLDVEPSNPLRIGNTGPDMLYYDLYPAVAFSIYPLHTFSLTLIAVLSLLVVTVENTGIAFNIRRAFFLFLTAAALAATRPYEPVMILGCYALLVMLSHVLACPAETRKRRWAILLTMAAGMLPIVGYMFWTAAQPVWKTFADASLNQFGDLDWFGGFFLLWLLAIPAIVAINSNALAQPAGVFYIWSAGCGIVLLAASSGLTKLCGGITIPLSLLAGFAVRQMLQDRPKFRTGLILGLLFCALASPYRAHIHFLRHPVRIQNDLLLASATIRADSRTPEPTVLTDPDTGYDLPGLTGFRVFCGHWALTDQLREKTELLQNIGFRPARTDKSMPVRNHYDIRSVSTILADQLRSNVFSYLIIRKTHTLYADLQPEKPSDILYDGSQYRVLKMTPTIVAQLQSSLHTTASAKP